MRHVPRESIELDRAADKVQGAAFNRSGHVFLSLAETAAIYGFSTFTGAFLGSVPSEMHPGGLEGEVAEGLRWAPLVVEGVPNGTR